MSRLKDMNIHKLLIKLISISNFNNRSGIISYNNDQNNSTKSEREWKEFSYKKWI